MSTPNNRATVRVAGGVIGGLARAVFAALAYWDLYIRPQHKINGKKPVWAFVIMLGGVGPLIYFFFAPKR